MFRTEIVGKGYCTRILFTVVLLMTVLGLTRAQNPGDEDKDLFNKAMHRDRQEMSQAIEGWWTASMKNHEQRIQW